MVVFVSGYFFHMYQDYYIGAGAIFKIPQYLYLQPWMIPVNLTYGSIKHKQYNQDETKTKHDNRAIIKCFICKIIDYFGVSGRQRWPVDPFTNMV